MTGNLALYQMLLMMEHAGVTEIHWDGTTLRTVPPEADLHTDLLLTIRGGKPRVASKPFTLTRPA